MAIECGPMGNQNRNTVWEENRHDIQMNTHQEITPPSYSEIQPSAPQSDSGNQR